MPDRHDMRAVRDRLVLAALPLVPFDGWSRKTLREAAKEIGFDPTMGERAFPAGPVAAVEHFGDLADRQLADAAGQAGFDGMRLSQRVAWLVRHRIEDWTQHREAIRRAVSLLSVPTNGLTAMRSTWRTVDTIWFLAGDTAPDFTYYTKRASLAALYTTTTLYWLDDKSEDFAETWAFMDRRLADIARLTKTSHEVRRKIEQIPSPLGLIAGARGSMRRHFGVRRS